MPLIGFLVNLIETFRTSSNNLVKECFDSEMFSMKTEPKFEDPFNVVSLRKELEKLEASFEKCLRRNFEASKPFNTLIGNLEFLLNQVETLPLTEGNLLWMSSKVSFVFSKYYLQRSSSKGNKNNLKETFHQKLAEMQAMKKPLIFLHSHIRGDFGILEANLKGAIRYFKSINESEEGIERYGMHEALRSIKDEEFKGINKIMSILKSYKESINSDCYIPFGEERLDTISSTLSHSMMIPFQKIKEFLAFLRGCSINEIQTSFKFIRVKKGLREYISRVFEQ